MLFMHPLNPLPAFYAKPTVKKPGACDVRYRLACISPGIADPGSDPALNYPGT
jgi:hypothetical protein